MYFEQGLPAAKRRRAPGHPVKRLHMIWIAPSEKDQDTNILEKRLCRRPAPRQLGVDRSAIFPASLGADFSAVCGGPVRRPSK